MEDLKILTKYIAAWCWQLIAVILLTAALIAAMLSKVIYIIGIGVGIFAAEFMALKRQREIYNEAE